MFFLKDFTSFKPGNEFLGKHNPPPDGFHQPMMNRHHRPFFLPLFPTIIFLLVFILSTGLTLLEELFDAKQKKQEADNEKSKAELNSLKSQINPHFLFNTLNGIYSLSLENSPKTPEAIMKLSGLMRYALTEVDAEFVPLAAEIEYIHQYIDLQKIRITDNTEVTFTKTGDVDSWIIAPLLISPFVENAFKYGVSTNAQSWIKIAVDATNKLLSFTFENKVINTIHANNTKLGISNVKNRLLLIYPGLHELKIINDKDIFFVSLKIWKK